MAALDWGEGNARDNIYLKSSQFQKTEFKVALGARLALAPLGQFLWFQKHIFLFLKMCFSPTLLHKRPRQTGKLIKAFALQRQ